VNLTCVHTGWTFTRTVRNNAHAHILGALTAAVEQVPFAVVGLDFDNGSEFLNKAVITWVGGPAFSGHRFSVVYAAFCASMYSL
jgi:hypothetical protein